MRSARLTLVVRLPSRRSAVSSDSFASRWRPRLSRALPLSVWKKPCTSRFADGALVAARMASSASRTAARRYMAWTGAGRLGPGALSPSRNIVPPRCDENGLRPDDVAVVEFWVLADGTVSQAMPVYASRPGPSALAFARAVARWTFETEGLEDVPLVLRSVSRVELRCTEIPRAHPPGYYAALGPWRALMDREDENSPPFPYTRLRERLAAAEAGARQDSAALVVAIVELARHELVQAAERTQLLRRALSLAGAAGAPGEVIGSLAMAFARAQWVEAELERPDFSQILGLPEVRTDAIAAAVVQHAEALHHFYRGEEERALEIASRLVGMPELQRAPDTLMHVRELIVAIHAARGDTAAAAAAFAAIGSDANACMLPRRQRQPSASSVDFPDEAMQWGFEGWTIGEVEVSPEGRATRGRTLISYPAFVFSEAGRDIIERTRFYPSYSPDGRGCPERTARVVFRTRP